MRALHQHGHEHRPIRERFDLAEEVPAEGLGRPLPDGLLNVYPLSTEINSSRAEGIELLTPLHG